MSDITFADRIITETTISGLIPQYPLNFQKIRSIYGSDDGKYDELKRGVAILKDEAELNQYLFSYGNMHEAKLQKAYSELFKHLSLDINDRVQVIDYACGQGLASIVLLNYLQDNYSSYPLSNLLKIILIEPSKIALDRAEYFLKESSNLLMVNKVLDDVTKDDLCTNHNTIKIHLFSNILDMSDEYFDADKIARSIIDSQTGVNYFVCVSALYKNKLDSFMNSFEDDIFFEELASFDGVFNNSQQWKINYNIFNIGI